MAQPGRPPLCPEERSKPLRAALLRPMSVLMLCIGLIAFAVSAKWWILPLTLATYGALVALAFRDPTLRRRVLEGHPTTPAPPADRKVSPERRARRLPHGETRQKVEDALVAYRKALLAIEHSDDETQAALEGTVPALHAAANRLVDVAHRREKAAKEIRQDHRPEALAELEDEVHAADEQISAASDTFSGLRSRIVRISIAGTGAAHPEASELTSSLDEVNHRLEARSEGHERGNQSSPQA